MHKFMPRRCFLYLLPNKSEGEGEFLASCPMMPAFQISHVQECACGQLLGNQVTGRQGHTLRQAQELKKLPH